MNTCHRNTLRRTYHEEVSPHVNEGEQETAADISSGGSGCLVRSGVGISSEVALLYSRTTGLSVTNSRACAWSTILTTALRHGVVEACNPSNALAVEARWLCSIAA